MTTPPELAAPEAESPVWLTAKQVGVRAIRSTAYVNRALRSGELRGFQKCVGGDWRITVKDADAWIRGEAPEPIEVPIITRPHAVR